MGKKNKPTPPVPIADSAQLKHSPFAALAGRSAPPSAATPDVPAPASAEPARVERRGRVVLRRETKHRGGKAVVIIGGLAALPGFDSAAIAELAKRCKQVLGCGGTVEDVEIVLQGDQPARVAEWLSKEGFKVGGVTS